MARPLYLDTSAVLRAVLETGTTPEVEARIADAPLLITSRLSLVESSRAFARVRNAGGVANNGLPTPRVRWRRSGPAVRCGS
jgi:hypothetical protein